MENKHEEAEKDYINGMTYKEIAQKYDVSENTVKSWKKRYGWVRVKGKSATKRVHPKSTEGCSEKGALLKQVQELSIESEELNEKMQQFCVYFVQRHNATKAYMKAYGVDYASAAAAASRLLKNVKIKNYIKELKAQKAAITLFDKDDLVQRYMDIAYMDVREIVDINEYGTGIKINPNFDGTLVSQIKETRNGINVKLPDRMKAMAWLDNYFEVNPGAQRKKEYEMLKAQQLRQQIEQNKRMIEQEEDEKEEYGAVLLAPVLDDEEEDGVDECVMGAAAETN